MPRLSLDWELETEEARFFSCIKGVSQSFTNFVDCAAAVDNNVITATTNGAIISCFFICGSNRAESGCIINRLRRLGALRDPEDYSYRVPSFLELNLRKN